MAVHRLHIADCLLSVCDYAIGHAITTFTANAADFNCGDPNSNDFNCAEPKSNDPSGLTFICGEIILGAFWNDSDNEPIPFNFGSF